MFCCSNTALPGVTLSAAFYSFKCPISNNCLTLEYLQQKGKSKG